MFDCIETWSIERLKNQCGVADRSKIYGTYSVFTDFYNETNKNFSLQEEIQPVEIHRGVRQRDTLSPKLFIIAL